MLLKEERSYLFYKNIILNYQTNKKETIDFAIMNIQFFQNEIENDNNKLELFYKIDNLLCEKRYDINIDNGIKLWNRVFKLVKLGLTEYTSFEHINSKSPKVFLSFTTCKRIDLFQQTVNSLLKHCEDISIVDYWFCVDDNSSRNDRNKMKELYPWIDYYEKNTEEKGHRKSMNLIYDKLVELKPTYWIHVEDDFLFHHKMPYIILGIEGLRHLTSVNVKQIVFNINYGETINDYKIFGHTIISNQNFILHNHNKNNETRYLNCQYWPNYSFRPSIIDVSTIIELGNFDTLNTFFEIDYANKWTVAGYKTAFFNRITCRHIGRLTSDRNNDTFKNAYKLNNENQFCQEDNKDKTSPIKIINLERRQDRKDQTIEKLSAAGFSSYEFIKAVDGKNLESTDYIINLFKDNDFRNRRGVIGCALSHYNLWKRLLEDENNDYYLVLEDDFTLCRDFKSKIEKIELELKEKELIFLGYHMFEKSREKVKDVYDIDSKDTLIFHLNKNLYIGGTFAYSINKVGAKNLIEYINKNGIKHGIDYLMKIADNLNSHESRPHLFFSEWNEGGKEIDTDIQNDRDCLNFDYLKDYYLDKFIFCENLDQIHNDMFFARDLLGNMLKKAYENDNCVGVNSLGFFKNKVLVNELAPSKYLGKDDGIYIKRDYILKQVEIKRIKMLCNWTTSEKLCKEWSNMCEDAKNMRWKNIQLTWSNNPEEIDYYVIINKPLSDEDYYDPKKTIIFHMEPWVYDESKLWGVKTWKEWSNPDGFYKVISHKTNLNNVQWCIDLPSTGDLEKIVKIDRISSICSNKNFDIGHILRNNFIKHLDSLNIIDVFSKENYNNLKSSYVGPLLGDNKLNGLIQYKYYFMAENNCEYNYATEKIWEPILCECLCFYWGCPNLENYIDERAFVRLPLEDVEKSAEIIKKAIDEDWHTKRLPYIREAKTKILNELGFFPILTKLTM